MFSVSNSPGEHTISVRLTGTLTEREIDGFVHEYLNATDSYRGGQHLVLADLRGMRPVSPRNAEKLGAAIAHARAHGVVCCVHLQDVAIAKLQILRLAREVDPHDQVTVNVVSLSEAHAVLAKARREISNPSPEPQDDRAA